MQGQGGRVGEHDDILAVLMILALLAGWRASQQVACVYCVINHSRIGKPLVVVAIKTHSNQHAPTSLFRVPV